MVRVNYAIVALLRSCSLWSVYVLLDFRHAVPCHDCTCSSSSRVFSPFYAECLPFVAFGIIRSNKHSATIHQMNVSILLCQVNACFRRSCLAKQRTDIVIILIVLVTVVARIYSPVVSNMLVFPLFNVHKPFVLYILQFLSSNIFLKFSSIYILHLVDKVVKVYRIYL
jgi:hypothetical protein